MECKITIEVLDNGYEVEIPDVAAMNKAEADAKKAKPGSMASSPYSGDFMKSYVAKTVKDVLAIVTPALKNMPQSSYDEAFAEAVAED
jgi:hypothetical protein